MRKLLVAAAALSMVPGVASAAVVVTSTDYGFATTPAGFTGPLVTFDGGAAGLSGFTLTGTGFDVRSGTSATGAAPAISATLDDTTSYLNVLGGGAATLASAALYTGVSIYWGSIDTFNTIELLNGSTVVGTINNLTPGVGGGDGNQDTGASNRRVTITSTLAFNAVRFGSTTNSFELDNVQFATAVPEPTTWAMMIGGFGLLGGAMRRRRIASAAIA